MRAPKGVSGRWERSINQASPRARPTDSLTRNRSSPSPPNDDAISSSDGREVAQQATGDGRRARRDARVAAAPTHQFSFSTERLLEADDIGVAQHAKDFDLAKRRFSHLANDGAERTPPSSLADAARIHGVMVWRADEAEREAQRALTISSSSDSLNFLIATISAFSLFRHFRTTPYAPSPTTPRTSYLFTCSQVGRIGGG